MNPYSPELNYFLAYQYCRSIGLQLASFESKEKADSMTQYLLNAGKCAALHSTWMWLYCELSLICSVILFVNGKCEGTITMTFIVYCSETRKQPHTNHFVCHPSSDVTTTSTITTIITTKKHHECQILGSSLNFFSHTKLTLPEVPSSVLSYLMTASYRPVPSFPY